jgi:CubicO group peptidase (beta-lactamase class C family)
MAKSITQALAGILVRDGRLDIFAPASVPEWADPNDPRHAITTDQLLRMSSGLQWDEDLFDPDGDVLTMLHGAGFEDRGAYAAAKPLASTPDTEWYYSTGTTCIVSRIIADAVGRGDDVVEWIDDELFSPLGIDSAVHDLDRAGVFNGGSIINMTAQDFARFGLLYLRDGMWDGRRILPEGWVDYSRTPTPTTASPTYGSSWWLDPERPSMFYALGFEGQSIAVLPNDDVVVVVLSHAHDERHTETRNALADAFSTSRTSPERATAGER